MKIQIEKSKTFGDVQIVKTPHPAERNITSLTWDELQVLVTEGQKLLDQRNAIQHSGLTETDLAEMAEGIDYTEYDG